MRKIGILAVLTALGAAQAGEWKPGTGGADVLFYAPIGGYSWSTEGHVRGSLTLVPAQYETHSTTLMIAPMEGQIDLPLAEGSVQISKARAAALRFTFHGLVTDVASLYKDADRGISGGLDVVAVRIPIRILKDGRLLIQPGLELGARQYGDAATGDAGPTVFNASFNLEARTAKYFLDNWLSTGIVGKLRYDLNSTEMSGLSESGLAYLSLLLDRDRKVYARVYAGVEHEAARDNLGLSPFNFFMGAGVHGNFSKK